MAGAYATLAAGGVKRTPFLVEEVRNSRRELLFRAKVSTERVADANLVSVLVDAMTQVVKRGTGTAAQLPGRPVAGKTGTTNEYEDAWFVGFTPQLATAVWMGAPRGKISMRNVGGIKVFGGTYPARVWHAYSAAVLENEPVMQFPQPDYGVFGKGDCLAIVNEPKASESARERARVKQKPIVGSRRSSTRIKPAPHANQPTVPAVITPVPAAAPPSASGTDQAIGAPDSRPLGGRGFSVQVPASSRRPSAVDSPGSMPSISGSDFRLPGSAGPLVPRATRTKGITCQDRLGPPRSRPKKKVSATTRPPTSVGVPAPVQAANTVAAPESDNPVAVGNPAPEPTPNAAGGPP